MSVLSHAPSMNDAENIPYYTITPSTLNRVKVVIGDVKSSPKAVTELLQLQAENKTQLCCCIKDLG
jgi:hypothetical protein